jgi:hypothetical protein
VWPHVGQSHSLEHELHNAVPWQETSQSNCAITDCILQNRGHDTAKLLHETWGKLLE